MTSHLQLGSAGMLCLLLTVPAHAQHWSFQTFGPEQGLTNSTILVLKQDSRGFLWVSTEGGLFRYDGDRFRATSAAFPHLDLALLPIALIWFGLQIVQGTSELATPSMATSVAWWAHIGGFAFGALFMFICNAAGVRTGIRTASWAGRRRHVPLVRPRTWL